MNKETQNSENYSLVAKDWGRYDVEVPANGIRTIKRDGEFVARVVNIEHAIAIIVNFDAKIRRLKEGKFTPDELQNLCHNLSHEDKKAFFDGCDDYQRKLFGTCRTEELEKKVKRWQSFFFRCLSRSSRNEGNP